MAHRSNCYKKRGEIVYKSHEIRDYSQGDAFQVEKRTVFSTNGCRCAPKARSPSPAISSRRPSVAGASLPCATRTGAVRVLRNACRHQNMPVVGTPSGNCESFRCRFHGWTYDLQGRFLSAPPPVAPADPQSPDLNLRSLPSALPRAWSSSALGRSVLTGSMSATLAGPMAARSSPTSPATGRSASSICWRGPSRRPTSPGLAAAGGAPGRRGGDHRAGRAAHLSAHAAVHPRVRRARR